MEPGGSNDIRILAVLVIFNELSVEPGSLTPLNFGSILVSRSTLVWFLRLLSIYRSHTVYLALS